MEIQISLQVEQMLFDKVRTFQLNNNLIWRCTEPHQKFWFGLFEVNMYKGKKERNWEVPLFVACPVCVPVFSLDDPSTTSLDHSSVKEPFSPGREAEGGRPSLAPGEEFSLLPPKKRLAFRMGPNEEAFNKLNFVKYFTQETGAQIFAKHSFQL